ncbi:phosphoribosyl-ATP diphosphatase [Salinisphaera sp. T31B1]|uniref:phosphoribosyl-ATP diphosphatase n=1 Tax=Salinisphaera sp. T31B1 TaxID=727963 RepID=UPI0033402048
MSNIDIFTALDNALAQRRQADPAKSYTASLYAGGTSAINTKITEEAGEVVEAALEDDDAHLVHEVADLWFHCMVLLQSRGLDVKAVEDELARRFGISGIQEKAARSR